MESAIYDLEVIGSNLGCIVLRFKSYLNQKYKCIKAFGGNFVLVELCLQVEKTNSVSIDGLFPDRFTIYVAFFALCYVFIHPFMLGSAGEVLSFFKCQNMLQIMV